MKNIDSWKPTKYIKLNGKLRANRDSSIVSISSHLITDLSAKLYESYIPIFAKGKLIDLGCGLVPLFKTYKPYITECVCLDWPNSLHQNNYIDYSANLNEPLPLPESEFDTIILSEVLEHIAEPEVLWSEMSRILKPKGTILIGVPFLYKIHEAPHDYFRYTEFALRNFALKNKLNILVLKSYGGLPAVFTDMFSKQMIKIPLLGNLFSRWIQSLCFWYIEGIGKNISSKSATHYPLGYFMVVEKP